MQTICFIFCACERDLFPHVVGFCVGSFLPSG
jgi:hypothetical protein